MGNKGISNKISYLSFGMAMLIVFYHWIDGNSNKLIFREFHNMTATLPLGYYFMISGYLLFYRMNSLEDLKQKIKRRVHSLLIPFLLWNLIIMILLTINNGKVPFSSMKELGIRLSVQPFDGPLWYIFALIIYLPLSYFIIVLKGKKIRAGIIFFAVLLVSYIVIYTDSVFLGKATWVERMLRYFPSYFWGGIVALNYGEIIAEDKLDNIKICRLAKIFFLISIWGSMAGVFNEGIMKEINIFIQPVLLWLAFPGKIFPERKPKNISKVTFFIFATHEELIFPVIGRIKAILGLAEATTMLTIVSESAVISVLTVVIVIVVLTILDKFEWTRRIMIVLAGGR